MKYKEYLDEVCSEVRFKAAHKTLRQELAAHIDDKKDTLSTYGIKNAEEQAIIAMGSAKETGKALNAIHKPRIAWGVIIAMLLLSISGVIILILIQSQDAFFACQAMENQIVGIILGLIALFGLMFIDYSCLIRLRNVIYSVAVVLYFACHLLFSWDNPIYTPIITLTPFLFLLSIIGFIEKNKHKGVLGLFKVGSLCAVSLCLPTIFPSFYPVFMLLSVYLVMLTITIHWNHFGTKRWLYYLIIIGGIVAGVLFIQIFCSMSLNRIFRRFVIDSNNITGESYSANIARSIISGAQLIGPSANYHPNQGRVHIPYSSTEYVFTAIIGAYGWILAIVIALVFIAMFAFMIIRSSQIRHSFGRLISVGISTFLLLRFIACILTNIGILENFSCNLPLISYGRFDYIMSAMLIGIFLSVWRRSSFMADQPLETTSVTIC